MFISTPSDSEQKANNFFIVFDKFMKSSGYGAIKYSLQWDIDYSRVEIKILDIQHALRKSIISSIGKRYKIDGIKKKKYDVLIIHQPC